MVVVLKTGCHSIPQTQPEKRSVYQVLLPCYQLTEHGGAFVWVWVVPFYLCALLPSVGAQQQLSNVPFMKSKSFSEISACPGDKGVTATGEKAGSEASMGGPKGAAQRSPHPASSSPTGT